MSTRSLYRSITYPILVAGVLLAYGGCADEGNPGGPGAPPPPGPGPGPGSEASGPIGDSPTTRQIMGKLTKGPNSLTPVIGKGLEADPPAWETIQPQTKEYARLAAAMGKNDPTKGTKESWTKLSAAFADSAAALDKAAQAKNRDAALDAHSQITGSCMQCHQAHRQMGRGPGGPGGGFPKGGPPPPGGGFPKGGPPPPPPGG
jgi:hypothetical protein